MKAAQAVYDGINSELKEELPVLYDRSGIFLSVVLIFFVQISCQYFPRFSRIGCYVAVFSSVSNLRDIFYKEMNTVCLVLSWHITVIRMKYRFVCIFDGMVFFFIF